MPTDKDANDSYVAVAFRTTANTNINHLHVRSDAWSGEEGNEVLQTNIIDGIGDGDFCRLYTWWHDAGKPADFGILILDRSSDATVSFRALAMGPIRECRRAAWAMHRDDRCFVLRGTVTSSDPVRWSMRKVDHDNADSEDTQAAFMAADGRHPN